MSSNWKKVVISVPIGAFFLWLALRDVKFSEIFTHIEHMDSYGWIIPFVLVALLANVARSERWRLLTGKGKPPHHSTMFAGVMFGYVMNYAIPRLGEVSRCMYVGKRSEEHSTVSLLGTVVLERVIDVLCLLALIVFVFIHTITDQATVVQLFGKDNASMIAKVQSWEGVLFGVIALVVLFILYKLGMMLLHKLAEKDGTLGTLAGKILHFADVFIGGIQNVRHLKNWPYFAFLTVLMWLCYALMTYIPFYMFNMQNAFHLSFADGITVMILSAIGVTLPSPGAVGTYHWFVKQALTVLYGVPEVTGLAYAFVTHFFMLLVFVVFAPIAIVINGYLLKRNDK